jgi:hypothetical protein
MDTNLQSDRHSKRFALRIATMIDARLIWYKHYFRWADRLIAELDDPPNWLLEIATIKYYPDAVAAINRFVYSEPFESFDGEQCAAEHVACLFLRYQSGAISWATFLRVPNNTDKEAAYPVGVPYRNQVLIRVRFGLHASGGFDVHCRLRCRARWVCGSLPEIDEPCGLEFGAEEYHQPTRHVGRGSAQKLFTTSICARREGFDRSYYRAPTGRWLTPSR